MIIARVSFPLSEPPDPETVQSALEASIAGWRGTPGLIRKYYITSEDGREVGGIYVWESKEAAENGYTDAWREHMTGVFGVPPTITYLPCQAVLDNDADEALTPEPR
ncbi:YdhR family protein [Egibacter rhizosphaerae]|uniref:YdhR family protein n=1 Tax=Egibacter rhizosphaerae TaxID=1670831 RepID=UPI00197AEC6C|nr:YdhR family protein [Egibacter rhizosphaerae]